MRKANIQSSISYRCGSFPDLLEIRFNGSFLCSFSFNMEGFTPNFDLKNVDGVLAHFPESSEKRVIHLLIKYVNEGYNLFIPFN